MEKKDSNRRRFFSKIAKLGLAGGIGALLFGRLGEKTLIPPAQAQNMVIDAVNNGTGTTKLTSSGGGPTVAFKGVASSTTGNTTGLWGQSDSTSEGTDGVYGRGMAPGGRGVFGINTATSGEAIGVLGSSSVGIGVKGIANATTGTGAIGVWGGCNAPNGAGVGGKNEANTGRARGVEGISENSPDGTGVYGAAKSTTGDADGVYGEVWAPLGEGVQGVNNATTGRARGVFGQSKSSSGVCVEGYAADPGAIPLVARGGSGQMANLQEWQKSDETPLSVVDKDGKLGIGTDDPGPMLHIVSGETGPLTAASTPPGSAPNSFIAENLTSGNHKSQFTFRSNGANKWSFGNDVSGNGGQDFFFYDEVASTTPLRIDSSGVVHGNFQASDLSFDNGVRATEEGDGLAFKNLKGEKIAVLDSEGNLQVKGKITENPNL